MTLLFPPSQKTPSHHGHKGTPGQTACVLYSSLALWLQLLIDHCINPALHLQASLPGCICLEPAVTLSIADARGALLKVSLSLCLPTHRCGLKGIRSSNLNLQHLVHISEWIMLMKFIASPSNTAFMALHLLTDVSNCNTGLRGHREAYSPSLSLGTPQRGQSQTGQARTTGSTSSQIKILLSSMQRWLMCKPVVSGKR